MSGPNQTADDPRQWRLRRTLARVGPAVEALVADHASSYWQRPARRHDIPPGPDRAHPCTRWSIDRQTVLELRVPDRGPATLVVLDFGLYEPLRKALRTRHVVVRHATARDLSPPDA